MPIDPSTIDRIAQLARLKFDDQEKEKIQEDLEKMLNFVGKLNEINTDDVEPLIYMTDGEDELRKDVVSNQVEQTDALKNAPLKDSDYIKVPKVIERKA